MRRFHTRRRPALEHRVVVALRSPTGPPGLKKWESSLFRRYNPNRPTPRFTSSRPTTTPSYTTCYKPFLVQVLNEFPDVPVIAAGGIGDGRSLAAVLAAGAEGAWIGTAFTAAEEDDEIPDAHKELIVGSGGEDTIYTQVFDIINTAVAGSAPWPEGIAGRVYNNNFAKEWHGRETELRDRLDEIIPAYTEARQRGDFDVAPALSGKSAASVNAIRPAAEVLHNICEDAERLLR